MPFSTLGGCFDGQEAGKSARVEITVSHRDGYELTAIPVAACLLLAFVAIALVSSALSGVYAAAVYRYAADGQSDGFFTPAMVRSAFRAK